MAHTGVPHSSETLPDPTVGLYLGSCGGPRGVAVSYERGTPVEDSQGQMLSLAFM